MKPAAKATLTSRSQLTLPKKIAALLGAEPGDVILFHVDGRRVYIEAGTVVPKASARR